MSCSLNRPHRPMSSGLMGTSLIERPLMSVDHPSSYILRSLIGDVSWKVMEGFCFSWTTRAAPPMAENQLRFQVTAWKDVAATSRMDVAPWFGQLWGHREGLPVSTKSKTKGLTPGVADCITQSMQKSWKQWKTWEDIYWLVVLIILNNISQWEGLSHILWIIKNVWNHQPY